MRAPAGPSAVSVTAVNLSACCQRDRTGVGGATGCCVRELAPCPPCRCALVWSIVVRGSGGDRRAPGQGTWRQDAKVTKCRDRLPRVRCWSWWSDRDPPRSLRTAAAKGGWRAVLLCLDRLPCRHAPSPCAGPNVEVVSGLLVQTTGTGGASALAGGRGVVWLGGAAYVDVLPAAVAGLGQGGRLGCL